MRLLLTISDTLDQVLAAIAKLGAISGLVLVITVCVDVVTRYLGAPKPFGLNSTQLQEAEYWFHTFLFTLMIGWAYTKNSHVRIDLVSSMFSARTRLVIEMVGAIFFLLSFSLLGIWYTGQYALTSFLNDESSKSVLGLSNVWILKTALFLMFVLLAAAAISQFIKSLAAYLGITRDGKTTDPFGVN
ncbi:TRAP transporter small permease subunit [Phaeobacter inhibens]|jgi:TRAP-type mannitol/chloroaromatic compound transport system permease small subunit|uniref:TRAP transporter small permease protein n=1 Tax=Phaeobacter inhibens TaxID=221822 RepID=A0A2I7KG33_9RHOB|nr:TRAP transporter small permease subunit [Phaeobacter inhibens]AUR01560.1 TRAP-type mannitol/chloroaromatic compound transport system, small permease component [Phaeobacter inhibens]